MSTWHGFPRQKVNFEGISQYFVTFWQLTLLSFDRRAGDSPGRRFPILGEGWRHHLADDRQRHLDVNNLDAPPPGFLCLMCLGDPPATKACLGEATRYSSPRLEGKSWKPIQKWDNVSQRQLYNLWCIDARVCVSCHFDTSGYINRDNDFNIRCYPHFSLQGTGRVVIGNC